MRDIEKLIFLIGTLGLLCLMLPGSMCADTVYTYNGNNYAGGCSGVYCTGGPYALSVTFEVIAGTTLDNLTLNAPGSDITADISSFTISDGVLTLTPANSSNYDFLIGTNTAGQITLWDIFAVGKNSSGDLVELSTTNGAEQSAGGNFLDSTTPFPQCGYGCLPAYGYNNGVPGTWTTSTTATPEPSSYLLPGVGLLAFMALASRKKRPA